MVKVYKIHIWYFSCNFCLRSLELGPGEAKASKSTLNQLCSECDICDAVLRHTYLISYVIACMSIIIPGFISALLNRNDGTPPRLMLPQASWSFKRFNGQSVTVPYSLSTAGRTQMYTWYTNSYTGHEYCWIVFRYLFDKHVSVSVCFISCILLPVLTSFVCFPLMVPLGKI